MKKITLFLICAGFLAGCGGGGGAEAPKAEAKKETKKIDDLSTREGMEKALTGLGIEIYPGAVYDHIAKDKSYGGYSIAYKIPEVTPEARKKVADFYAWIPEKFPQQGWKDMHGMFWMRNNKEHFNFHQGYMDNPAYHTITFNYGE